MAGAKLGDLGGGGWCMERRGSSGVASSSGNAPGAVPAYSLEELCHANGRPDISPPRPGRAPPLLTRRRGLQLAACLGLALMTLFWIWAWYPHGDAAGQTGGTMRGQKGRPGVFRTFRIRYVLPVTPAPVERLIDLVHVRQGCAPCDTCASWAAD